MRLKKADLSIIGSGHRAYKCQVIIDEFVESGDDICEIVFGEHEYASAIKCANSFYYATKKSKHPVKAMLKKGKVYLYKEIFNF